MEALNFQNLPEDDMGHRWVLCLTCNWKQMRLGSKKCIHCRTEFTKGKGGRPKGHVPKNKGVKRVNVKESDCADFLVGGDTGDFCED